MMGGLITPIVKHMGIIFQENIQRPLTSRSHIDLESLINMRMIHRNGESYGLVMHGQQTFYLPNKKTNIRAKKNWLYTIGNTSEEESEEDGFTIFETTNVVGASKGFKDPIPLPIKKPESQVIIRTNTDGCTQRGNI
ncbi:hypothetical protein RYX36_005029 [Vicia faba]